MKKISTFIVMMLFVILAENLSGQTIEEYLEKGDSLYTSWDNQGALKVFEEAEKKYPGDWRILWRLSRTYTDIAEHMPASTDEQEEAQLAGYEKAVDFATKAIQAAPDQSVTYLRRAIANGRVALFKGVFSVGSIVDQVRDDAIKSIELGNGGNEIQGVTHYVLARTHDKISDKWSVARAALGLGWADYDSAMVHYAQAVKLYPDFLMIYVDYAKAYMEEDEWDKAKEMLNKAISSPIKDEDDEERLVEAKDLLKQVNEELE